MNQLVDGSAPTWKRRVTLVVVGTVFIAWTLSGAFLIWNSWNLGWVRRTIALGQAFLVWALVAGAAYLWVHFFTKRVD